jgi:transposase-like protein
VRSRAGSSRRLRQVKYLNNIVEQDHRRVKRLVRPGLGFGAFHSARRTLAGYEAMIMIRKRQLRHIAGYDMAGQAAFIASLFATEACLFKAPRLWPVLP